ncbi:MAG TPA: hypothetical protein VHR66_30775 [Gemmataceae bacterium]|jgi:hypothetical protein|nr:hypothetical protein [Gemmataceae bacterium]
MAQHGRKAQKKLAKKKAKRAEKRSQVSRLTTSSIESLLLSAVEWPILETLLPVNLWNQGIGNCIIARQLPNGRIAFANILLDTFCLGVKDAFVEIVSLGEYQNMRAEVDHVGRLKAVSPELFAKLVNDAIDYAADLGFQPHPDFAPAELLLEGIDTSACYEQFAFGKDGKPLYIQGPNDSPGRIAIIANKVQAAGGTVLTMLNSQFDEFDDADLEELDDED